EDFDREVGGAEEEGSAHFLEAPDRRVGQESDVGGPDAVRVAADEEARLAARHEAELLSLHEWQEELEDPPDHEPAPSAARGHADDPSLDELARVARRLPGDVLGGEEFLPELCRHEGLA